MVSFFKSYFPSRLVALIILYFIIRIPLLWLGFPETLPELRSMLLGEKMSAGFSLYSEIYETTAPLSAFIYWIVDLLFGRSYLTYRIIAMALVLIQALRLNQVFVNHGVYSIKTYIPALIYLLAGSTFFEFDILSPVLIGNTFIILSLNYLLTFSKEGLNNKKLFKAGFFIGLASLSYLPLSLFIIPAFFAIVFYASNTFRSLILLIFGILFPYLIVITYFFYTDSLQDFLLFHLLPSWQFGFDFLLNPSDILKVFGIPLAVLVLSFFAMVNTPATLVFQINFRQLIFIWIITAIIIAFSGATISVNTFILILPALAFYAVFLFKKPKRPWIVESIFILFLASVIVFRYYLAWDLAAPLNISTEELIAEKENRVQIEGKKVLVLGEGLEWYKNNIPSTPYINWSVAKKELTPLTSYSRILEVYKNFNHDMPEVIIDKEGIFNKLREKLPIIFDQYEQSSEPGVYVLQH